LTAWFRQGHKDYYLGGDPLWQVFRTLYQMTSRPYFVGGALLFCGYMHSLLRRSERPIPMDLIKFHRREQRERLKTIFKKALKL
jgi:biofilm PGA synthesis N-glycosyltransferase PgaC